VVNCFNPRLWKIRVQQLGRNTLSAFLVLVATMAEEDGYAVMEDMDFDWLYVEDDYPLSVRIGHVLLGLDHLHVSA
jgi:hypothetical protein